MKKICPICDITFKDGDKLVAVMLSEFKEIDSGVAFAIEQPHQCIEIVHSDCFDWEDYPDFQEETLT